MDVKRLIHASSIQTLSSKNWEVPALSIVLILAFQLEHNQSLSTMSSKSCAKISIINVSEVNI